MKRISGGGGGGGYVSIHAHTGHFAPSRRALIKISDSSYLPRILGKAVSFLLDPELSSFLGLATVGRSALFRKNAFSRKYSFEF